MGALQHVETFIISAAEIADNGVPSASMAMLDEAGGSVQSHVITQEPKKYNTETVYQAGSISKAITALAVAKLIDIGHLTYETKVVDHVPESLLECIVDDKTRHLMQYVTVGLLVSHRSGLSQHGFIGYTDEAYMPTYEQFLAGRPPTNSPRIKFLSFPGSQYAYSGGGFTLLQILLEHIMGKPFPEIMHETVLGPLNMTRSHYGDLPSHETNYARAYVAGYVEGTIQGRGFNVFRELAAAGLWTTPSDLLKAVSAVQISLHSDSGFLSRSTADMMLAPVTPDLDDSGRGAAYGWGIDGTFFAHSGMNDPGYVCYVIGAHGCAAPVVNGTNGVGTASLCIMTNSIVGFDTIERLVMGVFCTKAWPLYESLPGIGKLNKIIPYPGPEGCYFGDQWWQFLGQWTDAETQKAQKDACTPGGSHIPGHGEWEIFEDGRLPCVAFDGVKQAMRLRPGSQPWGPLEGGSNIAFVVDGLQMAFRMISKADGTKSIELVQDRVTTLTRVSESPHSTTPGALWASQPLNLHDTYESASHV